MDIYVTESFNLFSGVFSGYDFISTKHYVSHSVLKPILIGKNDVHKGPSACCAKNVEQNTSCNSHGKFKMKLYDGKWYCSSHLWMDNRIFEYKHDYVRQKQLCSICHDDIYILHQKVTNTLCEHSFHTECLDKWLEIKKNCPICRQGLFDEDDPLINHKLVHNHFILSKALELNLCISKDIISYLESIYNESPRLQDELNFLKSFELSELIKMYNKVSKAINENTLIHMALYSNN